MTARRGVAVKLAFWLFGLALLVLALLPTTASLPGTGWDKSNHALGFLALAGLGLAAYPASGGRLLLGVFLYGGAIEIAQSFTSYRSAEWLDWLADAIGVGLAGLLWRGWPLRRRR